MLRPVIAATVLGAAVGSLLAAGVLFARADGPTNMVSIRQLQLRATDADSESRHHRDLDEQGRYSARHCLVE